MAALRQRRCRERMLANGRAEAKALRREPVIQLGGGRKQQGCSPSPLAMFHFCATTCSFINQKHTHAVSHATCESICINQGECFGVTHSNVVERMMPRQRFCCYYNVVKHLGHIHIYIYIYACISKVLYVTRAEARESCSVLVELQFYSMMVMARYVSSMFYRASFKPITRCR
jgi:hypothetical protein